MNSFKTRRQEVVPVKKQVTVTIDDVTHFPSLSDAGTKVVLAEALNYKKVTELKNELPKEETETESNYVPDGWVKYTVDKKTKKIAETYGAKVESDVDDHIQTPEEKQEEIFNELIDALSANWSNHRKTFIKCHGEDYYNDIFLMKNYVEMEFEEEQ